MSINLNSVYQSIFIFKIIAKNELKRIEIFNLYMSKLLKPVIKWVGGKSSCLKILSEYLPFSESQNYIEPFVGGGSILLSLKPKRFVVGDINPNLICMYTILKDDDLKLKERLKFHEKEYNQTNNKLEYYTKQRDRYNEIKYNNWEEFKTNEEKNVEIATLFIVLNKLCFNGLYRENNSGKFNVPFGKYPSLTLDYENIENVSKYFKTSDGTFHCKPYDKLINQVLKEYRNNLIYLDPPYYICDESKFTQYTNNVFTKEDHLQLYKNIDKWQTNKNLHIVCSNSHCDFTLKYSLMYKLNHRVINVTKSIGRNSSNEIISYTKNSNSWKQYLKYLSGQSKFSTVEDEKKFLSQYSHSVNFDSKRDKDCFNIGKLGEMAVARLFAEYNILLQKCPFKENVRPDGYIEIGDKKYIIEIKSRTYTCTGTASEKIDCIPRKLYQIYKKYGYHSIVIFVGGQIEEKSGKTFLQNDGEYITRFKSFAKDISGVEYWLSYNELEEWILQFPPANKEINNNITLSNQD